MTPPPAPLLFRETMPEIGEITEWLRALRRKAYVPGSRYQVAAIVMMRAEDGFYFAGGVNVECYEHRLSLHGEESAIAALATAFGKEAVIDAVWVMAAPDYLDGPANDPLAMLHGQTCGSCRQQISGLARDETIPVTAITLNGSPMSVKLGVLLPHSFSFADFDPKIAERLKNRPLRMKGGEDGLERRLIRRDPQSERDIFDWLVQLESVDYASLRGQAVILTLENGACVAGVKFENAAYTGQGAMQAALGIAVTAFGRVKVRAVHSLSSSGGAEENGAFYPLPLSAYQSLSEFIAPEGVPVTLFNHKGESRSTVRAADTAFARPFL